VVRPALSWRRVIVFLENYPGISEQAVRDSVDQAGRDAWVELEDGVKAIAERSGMQNQLPPEDQREIVQTVLADLLAHGKTGSSQTDSAYRQFVRLKVRNEALARIRSRVRALVAGLREMGVFSTSEAGPRRCRTRIASC
jgi:hypothetical protein